MRRISESGAFLVAAVLGAVFFGLSQQQLILFMIMVQVASIAGAYAFGYITDRFSAKRSILIALGLMLVAIVWLYFDRSGTLFFVIGGIAGFALSAAQSISRAFVGKLAPAAKSAEFHAFFAMTGRTSSFIGPTLYGFIAAHAALWYQRGGKKQHSLSNLDRGWPSSRLQSLSSLGSLHCSL